MEVEGTAASAEDLLLLGKRGELMPDLQMRRSCPIPSIETARAECSPNTSRAPDSGLRSLCHAAASPLCRPDGAGPWSETKPEPDDTPAPLPATRLLALRPMFEALGMHSFDGLERLALAEQAAEKAECDMDVATAASSEPARSSPEPPADAEPPSEAEGSSSEATVRNSPPPDASAGGDPNMTSPSCVISTCSDVAMSMLLLSREPSPGPSQLQRLQKTEHRIDLAALEQPAAGAETPPTAPASHPPPRSFS